MIKFDVDKGNKAVISGDELARVREHFSVENKAAKFGRYRGRFMPFRKYIITPKGKFDIGMYFEIRKFLKQTYKDINMTRTESFALKAFPSIPVKYEITKLNLELRDYQSAIVTACSQVGRGVVVLATAGGKTLTMASLIQRIYDQQNLKRKFSCLVLVPDIGLVNQTSADFREYGVSFKTAKWSGGNDLDLTANVIVANMGILQSKKSDTSWLQFIDLLIVDEVHKLRAGNKINKILDQIETPNRFGFTGTMPEELEDQWNIIGKIGPVLYEKNSFQLREEKHIAKAKVLLMKLHYNDAPKTSFNSANFNPSDKYRQELDWLKSNNFRNEVITTVCNNMKNNSLLLVDRIEHGQLLYNLLHTKLLDKKVYFIRGDVAVDERERIRKLMETKHNVICVAISKIFSTGINIKNLHYIMFCSGGKAKVKIVQSIGRGLRKHESKDKLIIIDIADQLHYGKQHMAKRIKLYKEENFNYDYQDIKEKEKEKG